MTSPLRIVGLGGNSGSGSALRAFVRNLPTDAGASYVIVAPSVETGGLGDHSMVPVVQLSGPVALRPDHVYVAPDAVDVVIIDGEVHMTAEGDPEHNGRVDRFFRSLANLGKDCAAVVLSGASADGTLGIKQVKEQGGLTVAQDPAEAAHEMGPRTAIQTGLIDVVTSAAGIPERLVAIFRSPQAHGPSDEESLRDILTLVRIRSGHDFSHYKRATLLRRVGRRLQVCGAATIGAYLRYVRENPSELASLLRDFLISVTHFFRDADAFASLDAMVLRKIFSGRDRDSQVRIWTTGCATGEEAYTLAIMCAEHCARLEAPPPVQIFATDIDEDALAEARTGRYPDTIAADVSPERLARFFTREDGHYRVKKEIREMLFSAHNLLRDPPFSRLDLVSCRNLLIYLDREAQDRVLGILHFALAPEGFLFLGSSESADGSGMLFAPADSKHRIYARRLATSHIGVTGLFQQPKWPTPPPAPISAGERPLSFGELHHRLVEHYAAPSVLVDDELEVVHVSEHAGRFLTVSGGEPTRNLLRLVHPALRLDLRAAIYAARQADHKDDDIRSVRVELDGVITLVRITVRAFAVPGLARSMLLVVFDEQESVPPPALKQEGPAMEPVVRQLEEELVRTREQLRSTIEQYETSVEELKASNEELHAINEELRSATEELETSKEELQSVNEELTTLNHELKDKIDEVSRANSDLQNLMTSTEIAVVFLDRQLHIKRFTPRAQDIFNVIGTDIGRPLAHLTHRLDVADLDTSAAEVLQTLRPVERELRAKDGRYYLTRIHPYRSVDDRIDGVVLTFLDITELEQAEEKLRASERMLRVAEKAAEAGIWRLDTSTGILEMSEQLRPLHGLAPSADGLRLSDLIASVHELDRERVDHAVRKALHDRSDLDVEFRIVHPQKGVRWLWKTGRVEAEGRALSGITIDITARRGAEAALRASEERFRLALRTAPVVMLNQDRDLRYTWGYMLGGSIDFIGKTDFDMFPPEEAARLVELKRGVIETGIGRRDEVKLSMGGRSHYYDFNIESIRGESGQIVGVSCAAVDVTPSKLAEITLRDADRRKDEFLATLAHELRNPLAPLSAALDIQKLADGDTGRIERARGIAERQVEHLIRLVDDLLDVSRITQGKIHLRLQKARVASIVDAALEATRGLFEAARHELDIHVPADLELESDAMRMTQVITNLLSNAAKYTPSGGHVALRAGASDGVIELSVRDDGVGLDAKMLPHVFDLFAQADGASDRSQGGLGIGLNLVRRLVELHGGSVEARSEGRGKGADFVVRVPVTQERSRVMAMLEQRSQQRPTAVRKVLVVDDNRDVTQTIAELLRMIGHEVHVADDGPGALVEATRTNPDVVLLDLGLPGMSGYDVARKLRELPGGKDMVIVAVTGWGQPDDLARSQEAGFDHHLVKPAGLVALREILGEGRR